MSASNHSLSLALQAAAVLQFVIALVNLGLESILGWRAEMAQMPLLLREVHRVHSWFISVTVALFGLLTWRFAAELAAGGNPIGCWLVGGIAVFWGLRTVLQITYYSASHWRGKPGRTLLHLACLAAYGGLTLIYALAAR